MAIPIINLTTSVLGYKQWQNWAYQPAATNTPTGWTSSALPPGLSLNATTGLLSGAVTVAGVYLLNLVASNGDGPCTVPALITIGIDPATVQNTNGIDVSIDVGTGIATLGVGMLKEADDLMFFITFKKGDVVLDLGTLTTLQLAIKQYEPDGTLVIGDTFAKIGTGSDTVYQLYTHLASAALAAAEADNEDDVATVFQAILEIEWEYSNLSSCGPATLRRSTGQFTLPIYRNINP